MTSAADARRPVVPGERLRPSAAELRLRDTLIVTLTVLTGATDAVSFTKLGSVFTSVMTGNIILVGLALGHGTLSTVAHIALAIIAYMAGALAGGRVAGGPRPEDRLWPAMMTYALAAELALYLAFSGLWWAAGGQPGATGRNVGVVLCAAALGLQGATILRLGIPGLSTTYLTGTLTTVLHGLSTGQRPKGHARSVIILIALLAGAAIGALTVRFALGLVPAVLLVLLGAVVITGKLVLEDRPPG